MPNTKMHQRAVIFDKGPKPEDEMPRERKYRKKPNGRHWRFRKGAIDHWLEVLPAATGTA